VGAGAPAYGQKVGKENFNLLNISQQILKTNVIFDFKTSELFSRRLCVTVPAARDVYHMTKETHDCTPPPPPQIHARSAGARFKSKSEHELQSDIARVFLTPSSQMEGRNLKWHGD
jgi:hypothetical protein